MKHFPIFLAVADRRILLAGGGEAALAKLRLLVKTDARIEVFASIPAPAIEAWAAAGRLRLIRRPVRAADMPGAVLFYAANDNAKEDARGSALARAAGVLCNLVDNLEDSDFITPAIVDRDPVTVAIGTEGAAPVLARAIKSQLEAWLAPSLGALAQIGKSFRPRAAALPPGRARRDFWRDYYFGRGPDALSAGGPDSACDALDDLLEDHLSADGVPGHVDLLGAGPGDPELLTLKARKALDRADVILHDRLVAPEILELARREALILATGKEGFGPAMAQAEINALMITHAREGAHVVRLKSGDPVVFGRLDEEIAALDAAGIAWRIVPGITAASAAAAATGQSLTCRKRNSSLRILTGHDMQGFAEHDWRALAVPGEVAAIYMGKRSARFIQGRLLMHGAAPTTPVSVIENASRPDQRVIDTTLSQLADSLAAAELQGPALTLFGLAPRQARAIAATEPQQEIAL